MFGVLGLQPTLAAARRVFSLLDKELHVLEVEFGYGAFDGVHRRRCECAAFLSCSGWTNPGKDELGEYSGLISVLDGLDLSIKPGELIGIKGANGVGKSILIDLLMRFHEKRAGSERLRPAYRDHPHRRSAWPADSGEPVHLHISVSLLQITTLWPGPKSAERILSRRSKRRLSGRSD